LDKLKVDYLDSVILAIPPRKEEDTTPFEQTIQPYWKVRASYLNIHYILV